jgi:hypothetical protein
MNIKQTVDYVNQQTTALNGTNLPILDQDITVREKSTFNYQTCGTIVRNCLDHFRD